MKRLIITFFASFALAGLFYSASLQAASVEKKDLCGGANLSFSNDAKGCNKVFDSDSGKFRQAQRGEGAESRVNQLIREAITVISVIVGIVAVIMIIVGGFRFITSGGDSGRVTSARQTVLYGLIGLVIVALAQVIVRFVLNKATETAGN